MDLGIQKYNHFCLIRSLLLALLAAVEGIGSHSKVGLDHGIKVWK